MTCHRQYSMHLLLTMVLLLSTYHDLPGAFFHMYSCFGVKLMCQYEFGSFRFLIMFSLFVFHSGNLLQNLSHVCV
uniref:Secreted protein n=1 Tax=Rhizophora mucronata TaxID=61149 RepID=A0A2P2N1Q6_RHIMU